MTKIKSKKAQVVGQVFIFILAAVLALLIIIYGYQAIKGFTDKTEEIAIINFKTTIQNEIKTIASDFGSVKKLELTVPSEHKTLCLLDLSDDFTENYKKTTCLCSKANLCIGESSNDFNPDACDAWLDPEFGHAAFLIPAIPIKVEKLEIGNDYGYMCIAASGSRIYLRLEGKGDRTKVSRWPIIQ